MTVHAEFMRNSFRSRDGLGSVIGRLGKGVGRMVLSLTPATELFEGGGDAGALLRDLDWAASPLGSPAEWPDALKVALGMLLPSSVQICLFWGPELVAFYNDAYAPAIGANHPEALGRPAREGWAALWTMLEPLLRDVMRTGRAFNRRDHPFPQRRFGYDEDTFFDVSYSPVRDAAGRVGGVFCIVSDQTRRVVDERRLHTLRALSLQSRGGTAEEAATAFVAVLGENDRSDAPYTLVYLRGPEGGLVLRASHGGTPIASLKHAPADPAGTPDPRLQAIARVARTGEVERIEGARFLFDPPEAASEQVVMLPLRAGHDIAGVLVCAKNRRLQPNADYRRFFELLAAQLSAALSAARVLSDERHRTRVLEQQVSAALAEREVAESRLRQAQKMEAIGKLTGGVAHDFNNLLQVIAGYADTMKNRIERDGDTKYNNQIRQIVDAAAKATTLTQQLLAFSRKQRLEGRIVNLNQLVMNMADMAMRSLGGAIEITYTMASAIWNTRIDPSQAETSLLNIIINARDAMPDGGTITIKTENIRLTVEDLPSYGLHPGRYVCVAVTDSGTGIEPEILKRVMDPFFTTKEEGKGTGLGLSMVYGFAKQSGGMATVESTLGKGTTVKLLFPASEEEDKTAPDRARLAMERGGTETILVVDDRQDVAMLAQAMLEDMGYRVLVANGGKDALALLRSEPVDLLFSDIIMPGGMNGYMLAKEARRQVP
ncbi:MAG: response regulator, partial [Gluconacetobacter diazotrophicus]|nr:response regulator [Gluconacetobacter diazotrophicus]